MGDVASLALATPSTRDRYVDFLRVASLGGVILGHFLMSVVDDRPEAVPAGQAFDFTNILAVESWTRPATWILQVMPIFFVVGGFAHAVSWRSLTRRGGGYADFVRARIGRLVTPALVFAAIGMAVGVVIELGLGETTDYAPVLQVAGQLLWFIGIYLIVAGLAPPMLRLHERFGWGALAGIGALVVAVDVLRPEILHFGPDVDGIKWLNFALVWLFIHQMGFFYADGVADRVGDRRLGTTLFGFGAGGAALLIWLGPYGTAMVSYDGEKLSNLAPPTVVLTLFAVAQAGVLLLVRKRVSRWLERQRVWKAVIAGGGLAMTAFLWHFTALIGMYVGCHLIWPGRMPEPTTAGWWWVRIPQFVVFIALVVILVALFRWADRPPRRREVVGGSWWRATVAALGVVCAIVGMLGFAVVGFRGVVSGYVAHVAQIPMTAVASFAFVVGAAAFARVAVRR